MAKFWALNNFFYLIPYYIKRFFSTLKTSPFDSIWLEISTNWHTTSQGPKKKSIKITKGRIDPCPAHTARNKGSFTTMVLWIAQRFLSSTVYVHTYLYNFMFTYLWPFFASRLYPASCRHRIIFLNYKYVYFKTMSTIFTQLILLVNIWCI